MVQLISLDHNAQPLITYSVIDHSGDHSVDHNVQPLITYSVIGNSGDHSGDHNRPPVIKFDQNVIKNFHKGM